MSEPTDFHRLELFSLVCGKVLGEGVNRTVYEHALDPHLVIKLEHGAGNFSNVTEWQVWQAVEHTEHARWFAPCVGISPHGGVLVMRRTTPAARHPEHIPSFFTDTKLRNYGVLTPRDGEKPGQFVCHDYGLHLMLEKGMTGRLVKAKWWNEG
jgi:hypothetical protein